MAARVRRGGRGDGEEQAEVAAIVPALLEVELGARDGVRFETVALKERTKSGRRRFQVPSASHDRADDTRRDHAAMRNSVGVSGWGAAG